jgi:hypothetical protein
MRPLSLDSGILQNTSGKPTNEGGFLLLDDGNDVCGLVLYDSSRCEWTVCQSSAVDGTQASEYSANASRLLIARWLDHARLVHA